MTKAFKLELPQTVRTAYVAEMEETFILCCYPKDGQRGWKLSPKDMQQELNSLRARASIVQPSPDTWWLRLAVPYYTDVRDLILLTQLLNKVTR